MAINIFEMFKSVTKTYLIPKTKWKHNFGNMELVNNDLNLKGLKLLPYKKRRTLRYITPLWFLIAES